MKVTALLYIVLSLLIVVLFIASSSQVYGQATGLTYGLEEEEYEEHDANTLAANIAQAHNEKIEELIENMGDAPHTISEAETCEALCNQTCEQKSHTLNVPLATCRLHCINICEEIETM